MSNTEKGIIIEGEGFTRNDERNLPVATTPMSMLAVAVRKGMDPDTIARLLALQKEWEANEARKAYAVALAEFKEEPICVKKDKKNLQYDSMYTTKGQLVNVVNPFLSKHGLSAHWTFDQTKGISVTCRLTHKMGHSESVTLGGMPDDSGKKNPLQQIKSAITYLEIATFEAVTGIASTEGSMDDDGNASGKPKVEPDAEGKKALEACGSMKAFALAWNALSKEQRKTLHQVRLDCEARIKEAEKAS